MRHDIKGFTLVELLVALVIGLLITLAAVSSLIVTRRGFSTVDAASQLRDNGRFAADLIQRVANQAGFKDPVYAIAPPSQADLVSDAAGNIPASITGYNNAVFDDPNTNKTLPTVSAIAATDVGYGSDVLILRYQTAKLNNDASDDADGTMIDCAGNAVSAIPVDRNDRMVSVFYVSTGTPDGEPSLMCSHWFVDPINPANSRYIASPIVQGVENLQVLYGVDGFTSVNTAFNGTADSIPEKYLRADQIVVGGNMASQATYNNWRRVRSIRIGMVIRGPANSQQEKVSQTFFPFGMAADSANGTPGFALSTTDDATSPDIGTRFTPPVDGRLRQVVTFTIHLRNDQGL